MEGAHPFLLEHWHRQVHALGAAVAEPTSPTPFHRLLPEPGSSQGKQQLPSWRQLICCAGSQLLQELLSHQQRVRLWARSPGR